MTSFCSSKNTKEALQQLEKKKNNKKNTMKVKCLSLLRTGNKRICGLWIHGI